MKPEPRLNNFSKFILETEHQEELRTIRTLDNSDLGQFGPDSDLSCGQFGPWSIRTLVNSDLDLVQFGPHTTRSELTNAFLKIGSELTKVRIDYRSELTKVQTK